MAAQPVDGIDYRVATLGGPGPLSDWAQSLGMTITCLGESDSGRISLTALAGVLRLVRRERPTIIYVIGIRAAIYMRVLKPLLRGALIVHGVRMNYTPDRPEFAPMVLGDKWLGGLTAAWITNSSAAAQTLARDLRVPSQKISVIYNGIDVPPQTPPPPSSRPNEVLTIANLAPRKGHIAFLEAIRLVIYAVPDVHFTFVGRDAMAGQVQRAIDQAGLGRNVRYAGFSTDTNSFLMSARVFVLPSFKEGMPTAILEAMASGLPVVAFPVDGIVDQVVDGITGQLPPTGDQSAMASAIISYLRDDGAADAAGLAGRSRAASLFTYDRVRESHAELWRQLAADRSLDLFSFDVRAIGRGGDLKGLS